MRRQSSPRRANRGFALLALFAFLIAGVLYIVVTSLGPDFFEAYRARKTEAALAEARDALVGFSVSYRDTHPGQVFGFLPCPDTDNDGIADPPCGVSDVTVAGRLPWKTLGLSDLRDGSTECLWYVVGGHSKDNPKTALMNWDTLGYINLKSAAAQDLFLAGEHDSPLAIIIAPGTPLVGQDRSGGPPSFCGGNSTGSDYLEGLALNANPEDRDAAVYSIVTAATPASIASGTNNDRTLILRSTDIFDKVARRSDFKADIDTILLDNLAGCLNLRLSRGTGLPSDLPQALSTCSAPANSVAAYVQANWFKNLFYRKHSGMTVSGIGYPCDGVLAFGGARESTQRRRDTTEVDDIKQYLSAPNIDDDHIADSVSGGTYFDFAQPTRDLFRCLSPTAPITVSFDNDMDRFLAPMGGGASVIQDDNHRPALRIEENTAGSRGGCLWFSMPIPLWNPSSSTPGRVWRLYFRSQLALGESDSYQGWGYGYGFTFQMLANQPDRCGSETRMGALLSGSHDWGRSMLFESDIYRNASGDPAGNHVAIFAGPIIQSTDHTSNSATSTPSDWAACNGTETGCTPTPPGSTPPDNYYYFEEPTTPAEHTHRIEIQTGCNSDCSTCDAKTPAGASARLRTWVFTTTECAASTCTDLTLNLASVPAASYCIALDSDDDWRNMYLGFTGGFSGSQSVVIRNFNLRAE